MEPPRKHRLARWKIPAALAAIPIVFVLAMWLWVEVSVTRRWSVMQSRTRELLAEWDRRDTSREPLRGTALEGNSWKDYFQADAKFVAYSAGLKRPLPGDPTPSTHLAEFLQKSSKADKATVQQIVDALQPALLDFRNGVARQQGRYPVDWSKFGDSPSLLLTTRLSNLALAQAQLWAETDRALEAVRLQLDVARFGQDIATDGIPIAQSMGYGTVASALDAVLETLLLGKLTPADLESVERELEVLERTIPEPNGLIQDRIHFGSILERDGDFLGAFEGGWRHAFSSRLWAIAMAEQMDHWSRRFLQVRAMGWQEVHRAMEEMKRDDIEPTSVQLWVSLCEAAALEARVRLLRTAVHWKRTGEKLKLQDPFGEHLNFQESNTGVKFWSTGPDGVDNLGAGGWRRPPDLVLEMPK